MKVFVAVGELQSFAGASRRLDISPAAVTRAVAALETRLGVRLLVRTSRSVRLTEAGSRYLEDTRSILASIAEADAAVIGANAAPSGNVSVTAPVLFGKAFVMPVITRFLQRFPQADVSAFFLDRLVNLPEEGVDVAVRIGPLADSGYKALRVGETRRVLCASPDYLARHGTPRRPTDLLEHAVIAASGVSPRVDWRFGSVDEPSLVRMKPRLTVTGNDVAIMAASAGLGIARLHAYQVIDELASGRLCVVLADHEEAPSPIHLLHRESRQGAARVRHFIDLLAADLGPRFGG